MMPLRRAAPQPLGTLHVCSLETVASEGERQLVVGKVRCVHRCVMKESAELGAGR